jgi:hypothetical protein
MSTQELQPGDFLNPAIVLSGPVDYDMYASFRDQLQRAPDEGLIVTVLSTLGGDPEVARVMGKTYVSTATASRASGGSSSWARRPSIRPARRS